jgi:hypothetical protein
MPKVEERRVSDKNPVGAIVQSMLTESQFQALNGTSWVIADGRSAVGTRYETETGNSNIPDLRGMVLRGKNNGRVDGNQNPDGELGLGTFQSFGNESHTHGSGGLSAGAGGNHNHGGARVGSTSALFGMNNGNNFHNSGAFTSLGNSGNHTHGVVGATGTSGTNETRMRNITVNNFIKIDL